MRIVSKKAFIGLIIFFSVFQFAFVSMAPAYASESLISSQEGFAGGEIGGAFNQTGKPADIRAIVATVIKVTLSIIGLVFVTILVLAGYRYMTANGNEDQTKTAIKEITQAVIGIIIVLAAWGITTFVVKQMRVATGNQAIIESE